MKKSVGCEYVKPGYSEIRFFKSKIASKFDYDINKKHLGGMIRFLVVSRYS